MAGGDRSALKLVVDSTGPKLFGICHRILGDEAEAEDAVQDVYVSVWHRASSFNPERASPITWLATIARNRAIDRLRSSRRVRQGAPLDLAFEIVDERPDPEQGALSADAAQRLSHCMDELEVRQQAAIRAAFFDGLSYPDLAERGKVPLGTMKSWIRRGLQQLKKCLDG